VNFPQVLTMMSEKLDLTIKLGDAFISQQKDVLDTVQKLRAKAQAQGNLKTTDEQKVIIEQAPPSTTTTTTQIIKIESPSPQVVYVPTYDPVVVYGGWPYPAYPPAPYYPPRPPGYVASAAIGFGVGVACGAAWGYAWGNCNWGHGDVDIDVNRNTTFNQNINRNNFQSNMQRNNTNIQGGKGSWQHDASHRGGVPYRDQKTAQKVGSMESRQASQARDAYRGRADTGRQDLGGGGADQFRGNTSGNRDLGGGAGDRGGGLDRGGGGINDSRGGAAGNRESAGNMSRDGGGSRGDSALGGIDRGGSSARSDSSRGQSSRSSSARSGGGGSRGGGRR
jgi:hypothetical protein